MTLIVRDTANDELSQENLPVRFGGFPVRCRTYHTKDDITGSVDQSKATETPFPTNVVVKSNSTLIIFKLKRNRFNLNLVRF